MNRTVRILAVSAPLWLAACAPLPERIGYPKAVWVPSPNHSERRPHTIVLHHTGSDTVQRALFVLTDPKHQVSSHYLIGRDGTIYQLVDERHRAWHAGASRWGDNTDLNSASIGIELDNNGDEPFAEPQIEALLALLSDLRERYRIAPENVLGHADVSPGRKVDPSRHFPWRRLAEHGFGLWCEPPFDEVPAAFDPLLGLQAFGYDVSNPNAALRAFKLRYVPDDDRPYMTEHDLGLLYCLLRVKTAG